MARNHIDCDSMFHHLPQESDGRCAVLNIICNFLDVSSLCRFVILSSLGVQFGTESRDGSSSFSILDMATSKVVQYRTRLMDKIVGKYESSHSISAPFVIVCETGHLDDAKNIVKHHRYIPGMGDSDVSTLLNRTGKNSDGNERTALAAAVKMEQESMVRYLLSIAEIDTSVQCDRSDCNVLHYAAGFNEQTHILRMILEHPTCTRKAINRQDKYGNTPLDRALSFNRTDAKESLISLLGRYGAKRKKDLEALIILARKEDVEGVMELLEKPDTDVAKCDSYGRNALHWAAQYNVKSDIIMNALLNHSTCTRDAINEKDRYVHGWTPLDWAYSYNNSRAKASIVTLLKDKGAKRARDLETKK